MNLGIEQEDLYGKPFTKWSFTLNLGLFSVKEHVLITVFANSGASSVYALSVLSIVKAYYHRYINPVAALLLVITTQMLGYGWAGYVCDALSLDPESHCCPGEGEKFSFHFWAPTFKWGISIANVADFAKPPEKLSYPQQLAVTCTGVVWSRYSMVITPKNWNLFSVNVAMATTGIYQLSRKIRHYYFSEPEEAEVAATKE